MGALQVIYDSLGYAYCKSFFSWLQKGNPTTIVTRLIQDTYGENDIERIILNLNSELDRKCIKQIGLYFRVEDGESEDTVYPFVMAFPVKPATGGAVFNPHRIEFYLSSAPMNADDENGFVEALRDDCGVHTIKVVDDCLTTVPYGYILSMVDRYQQRNLRGKGVQQE